MAGRVEAKVIHTARLTLRSPRPEDAPAVTAVLRDFEVARWLTQVPHPYALSDAEAYLRAPEAGSWVIEDAGGLAGMLTVNWKLGYWLAPRVWGRGYITEAVAPLLARHFSDPTAPDIIAGCMTGNDRSLAILYRLGFKASGSKAITPKSTGEEIDLPLYRLTRLHGLARNDLPVLAAPRLWTRELGTGDASRIVDFAGSPDVAPNLSSVKLGWSRADAEQWITRAPWRDRPGFRLGATDWAGYLIGVVGLSPVTAEKTADTMLAFDRDCWGQGYATKIMGRFLDACFGRFDLSAITADHFDGNPASGCVLQKLGFSGVGKRIAPLAARLEPAPVSLYRLRRDELRVGQ